MAMTILITGASTDLGRIFILMLLGMAVAAAFLGAAAGRWLAEELLDPGIYLLSSLWSRFRHISQSRTYRVATRGFTPASSRSYPRQGLKIVSSLLLLLLVGISIREFSLSPMPGFRTLAHIYQTQGLPTHGTLAHLTVPSAALDGNRQAVVVYLPPSYTTTQGRTKHYLVLYLLYGSPGEASDWVMKGRTAQSADNLIEAGRIPELMLFMPDGNGPTYAPSEWGNSGDQKQ